MNVIDPLSSSLYFSAAAEASKEAGKKQDKNKVGKTKKSSFASMIQKNQEIENLVSEGFPAEIAGLPIEEAVVFLKDAVDIAGDNFIQNMNADTFAGFRKSVSQFMKYISNNNYEVSKIKRFGLTKKKNGPFFSETRPKDPYVQIRVIDQKLDQLASMVLQNHCDKLKLMAHVDEIKGLLVDFFAA